MGLGAKVVVVDIGVEAAVVGAGLVAISASIVGGGFAVVISGVDPVDVDIISLASLIAASD